MKKLLNYMIKRWPLKVFFITLIILVGLATFVTEINLSTGNDTLIDTDTDTYQDNFRYQQTFGTDPVMIVFSLDSQEALLSYDSLSVLNELVLTLEDADGVFYINSPIGIVNFTASMSYTNYQTALDELSLGLLSLSNTIQNMSVIDESFDVETLMITFESLSTAQETLSESFADQINVFTSMNTNVSNEIIRLEGIKDSLNPLTDETRIQSLSQTVQILTNIGDLYDQLIIGSSNLSTGANQTAAALDQISSQLSTLFSSVALMETNMGNLASNLETMGNTLGTLADNFNMFVPAFPQSSETLDVMIHPEGVQNPMLNVYMIDDTHMYMSVILEESVSNDDIEMILSKIDTVLEESIHSDALISGKPVLDYDIQSSMMGSMKIMMISAGIIMVVILLILFPVKARLLPLLIVMLAVVTTVGIMGLFSIPLTMVSMAVFPVLIGLGIDYSIQFHNRYMEEDLEGEING